jgi:hypothetical protein
MATTEPSESVDFSAFTSTDLNRAPVHAKEPYGQTLLRRWPFAARVPSIRSPAIRAMASDPSSTIFEVNDSSRL